MFTLVKTMKAASVIKLGKLHALLILNIQRPPRTVDLIKNSKFHFDATLLKVLLLAKSPVPTSPNMSRRAATPQPGQEWIAAPVRTLAGRKSHHQPQILIID
jgi:hypothetical protein